VEWAMEEWVVMELAWVWAAGTWLGILTGADGDYGVKWFVDSVILAISVLLNCVRSYERYQNAFDNKFD
jgi:hypothetical protein